MFPTPHRHRAEGGAERPVPESIRATRAGSAAGAPPAQLCQARGTPPRSRAGGVQTPVRGRHPPSRNENHSSRRLPCKKHGPHSGPAATPGWAAGGVSVFRGAWHTRAPRGRSPRGGNLLSAPRGQRWSPAPRGGASTVNCVVRLSTPKPYEYLAQNRPAFSPALERPSCPGFPCLPSLQRLFSQGGQTRGRAPSTLAGWARRVAQLGSGVGLPDKQRRSAPTVWTRALVLPGLPRA